MGDWYCYMREKHGLYAFKSAGIAAYKWHEDWHCKAMRCRQGPIAGACNCCVCPSPAARS